MQFSRMKVITGNIPVFLPLLLPTARQMISSIQDMLVHVFFASMNTLKMDGQKLDGSVCLLL